MPSAAKGKSRLRAPRRSGPSRCTLASRRVPAPIAIGPRSRHQGPTTASAASSDVALDDGGGVDLGQERVPAARRDSIGACPPRARGRWSRRAVRDRTARRRAARRPGGLARCAPPAAAAAQASAIRPGPRIPCSSSTRAATAAASASSSRSSTASSASGCAHPRHPRVPVGELSGGGRRAAVERDPLALRGAARHRPALGLGGGPRRLRPARDGAAARSGGARPRRGSSCASPGPQQGATVRNPTMEVAIEGSVRMNGIEGGEYDVVLALDRSEATRRDDLDLLVGRAGRGARLRGRAAPAARRGAHRRSSRIRTCRRCPETAARARAARSRSATIPRRSTRPSGSCAAAARRGSRPSCRRSTTRCASSTRRRAAERGRMRARCSCS